MAVSQGPPRPSVDREKRQNETLAALWRAVNEASQFSSLHEIREFVDGTLREIQIDEP